MNGLSTSNWSDDTNWSTTSSLGPNNTTHAVAGDGVILDATSPACVINTTSACATLICTGYINTLTQNSGMTTTSTITMVAGMTFTYTSGTWTHNGTATITTGGKAFGAFTFAGGTITLGDDINIDGTMTISGATTVNTNNIRASGSVTVSGASMQGTATLIMDGTGTWSAVNTSSFIYNNTTINTAGTITVSGIVYYYLGIFTYTAGTVATTNSTLYVYSPCTLNTNGINWNNITLDTLSGSITLTSDLTALGTFKYNGAISLAGSFSIHAKGNVLRTAVSGGIYLYTPVAGSTTLLIDGSGNQTIGDANGHYIAMKTTIASTGGTVTFGGTIRIQGDTWTYTSGTVSGGTSTFNFNSGSCSINFNGVTLNDVTTSVSGTTTLTGAMQIGGNLTIGASTTLTCGANNLTLNGNFTRTGTFTSPTNTVIFNGTSTLAGATTFKNFTINAGKTVHLTSTQTFTVSGTFNADGDAVNTITLDSTVADSQGVFPVTTLGTVDYVIATDINSSGGVEIVDTNGTLDNATNWVTSAPTTSIKKVSGVAYASIKKVEGVAIASVKQIAGVP